MAEIHVFPFHLLQNIKEAQTQNGLRQNDYERYRRYCSRRLHRTRKALKFQLPKKDFKYKTVESQHVTEERFLHIPLFSAERCWSYAQQVKHDISQTEFRKRFHGIKLMKRATEHAAQLVSLCEIHTPPSSQIQARSYLHFLKGVYLVEKEDWTNGLSEFVQAERLLSSLFDPASSDSLTSMLAKEKHEQIQNYMSTCSYHASKVLKGSQETVQQIKEKAAHDADEQMQSLKSPSSSLSSSVDESLSWNGQILPVSANVSSLPVSSTSSVLPSTLKQIHASLRLVLLLTQPTSDSEMKDEEPSQPKKPMSTLEKIGEALMALDHAVQLVSHEVADQTRSEAHRHISEQIQHFLKFQRACVRAARQSHLLSDLIKRVENAKKSKNLSRPVQIVAAMDKLLRYLQQAKELALEAKEQKLADALNMLILYYPPFRLFYLACALLKSNRLSDCVSALSATSTLISTSSEKMKKLDFLVSSAASQTSCSLTSSVLLFKLIQFIQFGGSSSPSSSLHHLETMTKQQQLVAHAKYILEQDTSSVDSLTTSMSQMRLEEHSQPKKKRALAVDTDVANSIDTADLTTALSGRSQVRPLLHLPPRLVNVPCKPILFDLAFNSIEFPDLSHRVKAQKTAKQPAQSAAVSEKAQPAQEQSKGWLGRLWGR